MYRVIELEKLTVSEFNSYKEAQDWLCGNNQHYMIEYVEAGKSPVLIEYRGSKLCNPNYKMEGKLCQM